MTQRFITYSVTDAPEHLGLAYDGFTVIEAPTALLDGAMVNAQPGDALVSNRAARRAREAR